MDELEQENIDFDELEEDPSKRRGKKTHAKRHQRSHRTEIEEANLEDDE